MIVRTSDDWLYSARIAGDKIKIVDPDTGAISEAQIFVAVLGASNYSYAEAVPSQSLPHWTAAHVRAYLACALATAAIRAGHSACYLRTPRAPTELETARLDDRVRGSRYGKILKLPPSIGRTTPKCLRSRVTTVRV